MRRISMTIEHQGARLDGYLHEFSPNFPECYTHRPCVIVCPGGAYEIVSEREGDPVALKLLAQGFQVFTLYYSVGEKACNYQPLKELSQVIVTIRDNSDDWGIDPQKIAVLGFSAGAHLAGSGGVLFNVPAVAEYNGRNCPNAMVLCYPVISGGEYAHEASFQHLTGKARCKDWEAFSLERFVTPETPPCFLWHTVDDTTVPVQNTLLMLDSLQKAGVPYECHLYPSGRHGMSVCTNEVSRPNAPADAHLATWLELCVEWLNQIFSFEK